MDSLGDQWYVVMPAYYFFFQRWVVEQFFDFLGPKWKTVKDTRRSGRIQFFWLLVLVLSMIPYIVLQYQVPDYKEMATAISALLFSLFYLFRTWWSLWQLREFHTWATDAIRTLQSQGVFYELDLDDDEQEQLNELKVCDSFAWKADRIKVNEDVIDNLQSQYDRRCEFTFKDFCYFRKTIQQKWSSIFKTSNFKRFASKFFSFKVSKRRPLSKPGSLTDLIAAFSKFLSILSHLDPTRGLIQMKPYDPTDLWVRWSVVFASQGLSQWIKSSNIRSSPKLPYESSNSYDAKKTYHAREVLTSAYLLRDDSSDVRGIKVVYGPGHPLQWSYGGNEKLKLSPSFDANGKVSHAELLHHALASGKGLPFNAPMLREAKECTASMKSHEFDIKVMVSSMPAEFGNTTRDINFQKIEFLTVMLNLGRWECVEWEDMTTYRDHVYFERKWKAGGRLDKKDHRMDVLRKQIGMSTQEARMNKISPHSPCPVVPEPFTVPVKPKSIIGKFGNNNNVTDVSSIMDIWGAMNAGASVKSVLKRDESWGEACLQMNIGGLLDLANIQGAVSLDQDLSFLSTPSNREATHIEVKKEEDIRNTHRLLEKIRLAAEFGRGDDTSSHLHQGISFIGTAMESLRSALAAYVDSIPSGKEISWCPGIEYEQVTTGTSTRDIFSFLGTDCLSAGFWRAESSAEEIRALLSKRSVQIRVIWEAQRECIRCLQGKTSPNNHLAMMACLLSFPSLSFEIMEHPRTNAGDQTFCIEMEPTLYSVRIAPICGPQKLYAELAIRLIRTEEGRKMEISVRLCREDPNMDFMFQWEAWRDAFSGRMVGAREWKNLHDMESLRECTTFAPISEGVECFELGNKSTVKAWTGWLPNQPEICEFELNSIEGFSPADNGYERDLVITKVQEISKLYLAASEWNGLKSNWREYQIQFQKESLEHNTIREYKKWQEKNSKLKRYQILDLLERAAGRGVYIGLVGFIEVFFGKYGKLFYSVQALSVINMFIKEREHLGGLDPEMIVKIETLFIRMITASSYLSAVVSSFSRFQRRHCKFKKEVNEETMMAYLRQSFLRTGSGEVLREMIHLSSFCSSLVVPKSPLGGSMDFPKLVSKRGWGAWICADMYLRQRRIDKITPKRKEVEDRKENDLHTSVFNLSTLSTNDLEWMKAPIEDQMADDHTINAMSALVQRARDKEAAYREKLAQILVGFTRGDDCEVSSIRQGKTSSIRRNASFILGNFYLGEGTFSYKDLFDSIYFHGLAAIFGSVISVDTLRSIVQGLDTLPVEHRNWIFSVFSHCMMHCEFFEARKHMINVAACLIHDWKDIAEEEIRLTVNTWIAILERNMESGMLWEPQIKNICGWQLMRVMNKSIIPIDVQQYSKHCLEKLAFSSSNRQDIVTRSIAKMWLSILSLRLETHASS